MKPIRILVADDHPVVLEGIVGMLASREEFDIVGQADNGAEAVTLADKLNPDVILMDLRMPMMDGITAMKRILQMHPEIHILVLTTYDSDQDIQSALQSGATGYLLKDTPRIELHQAVIAAAQGKPALSTRVSQQLLEQWRSPDDALTEREISILALAAEGNTNKAIGKQLHISEATVKTHLKHIYAKLSVPDRASAVAIALKRNIIT